MCTSLLQAWISSDVCDMHAAKSGHIDLPTAKVWMMSLLSV